MKSKNKSMLLTLLMNKNNNYKYGTEEIERQIKEWVYRFSVSAIPM